MIVAVIEGGYSHEKQISVKSSQTILDNLNPSKYRAIRVRIDADGWFAYTNDGDMASIDKNDFSVKLKDEHIFFDYAFIVIHGTPGEDGKLQAYFDMMKIPYNTCSQMLATLTFDKFVCNRYLSNFGIAVANAILVRKGEKIDADAIIEKVGLPCFVKPNDGGSSFGVTKVKSKADLKAAIDLATKDGNGTQALIEQFLDGREVTNGVYRDTEGTQVMPITEIVTANEFFDFEAKYTGQSEEITPADLPSETQVAVKSLTKKVYEALNMTGMARMDYILHNDTPHLIEVNTVPGMSAESLIPQMADVMGVSLQQMLDEIITVSLAQ